MSMRRFKPNMIHPPLMRNSCIHTISRFVKYYNTENGSLDKMGTRGAVFDRFSGAGMEEPIGNVYDPAVDT
jgi:hypothetical protein